MLEEWPDFFWDSDKLSYPLAEVRHKQGRLIGKMEGIGFQLQNESNLAILTSEIVKSSAIEGETLDESQVRSSVAHRLGLDIGGITRASRSVDGFVEMLLDASLHYATALTKDRLLGWQAALFPTGYSGLRKITTGRWRTPETGPMQVVSGRVGNEKVRFEAPTAEHIDLEMDKFLRWINAKTTTCPVITAAIGHLWFITIHPFEDGNGRIARAITEMLLARGDRSTQRFYSMSTQIEAERKTYYNIIEQTQKGSLDITNWLCWFTGCLDRSLQASEITLERVLFKASFWNEIGNTTINERQRKVINRLLNGFEGFLTTSKYAKMTKCSNDTALRDIKELLTRAILLQNQGMGRSVSYRLGTPEFIK